MTDDLSYLGLRVYVYLQCGVELMESASTESYSCFQTVYDKFTPGGFAEEIFSGPPTCLLVVAEKSELPLFVKVIKEKRDNTRF